MKKRASFIAVFLAILVTFAAGFPCIEAEAEAGVCEKALSDCLNDIVTQATAPFGPISCFIGYTFCKKYIDPSQAA